MKKYITYLLATALVGSAFVSCTERFQEGEMRVSTHKVHFSASEVETRTGLSIGGTTVTPDWNKTALESIHLFEIDANDAVAYGETIAITTSEDKATAHFEADFPTDMSIIVDPSDPEEDSGAKGASNGATKGTRVSPYRYAAIIAQKPDKNNFTFVVPSEQHPDAETLKDPDADFLIGYSRKAYDTEHFFDEPVVDLYFDRVAALGRLAISNFAEDDGMVKSVTINAQNGLTGSASYADIDFENGKVNFVREEGPGAIALAYDGGMDIPADGPFYAYFVAIPGSATITSVEVVTDHYRYTKTIEGGKELTFSEKAFKSMNLDLSTATREEVAPSGLTWYKASVLEDGIDYLIVSQGQALKNNDGATAAVSVTDNEGVITLEAADPTIVWTATAHQEMTGDNGQGGVVAGHFTLTNDSKYLLRDSQEITLGDAIPSAKPKYAVWDYDGTYLKHESSETMTFYCYYDGGWATGYTQNGAAPGSSTKTVQIYTSRIPQELVFTPAASAEYDLATSEWIVAVPTLSGVQTSVTYALSEDSNPAVATVDADGTVHPLSRGTVTIVATAAGNDQYQAASASYTLRVVDSSVTTNTYIKVTSTSDLETGAQYLLVYEGGSKVFKPILESSSSTTFSKSTDNALSAEISGGTISSNEFENCHLTLESGYYLKADAAGKYLYPDVASSRGVLSAESTASHSLNITIGNNGIASIITKTGTYYLVWSTSSNYFSSNTDIEGSYSTGICLYKLDDGRLPQTLSFSPNEVNYDMAGSDALVKPTLSNAIGTVTYSSSDEAIATVDRSSGDVTVKKKGTVEITASAAGNSQYKPGSASYTLIITNSSITIPTWYKAEEIEAGETYLVVSNGYVLENNGGGAAAISVEASDGAIVFDAPASAIFTAAASSGKFTLQNNGQYMQRGGSSGSYVPTFSSSQGSYYQWTYDSAGEFVTATGNSTYYVYYSANNSKWSMGTSGGDSHKASLYTTTPPRQAQTLSFSTTSVNYDIAGGAAFTAPTLSGAQTAVTYSSSNAAVATVNATTGTVEIVGTGTTIITANAEGTDAFKPATASYTLRVIDSTAPVTTKRYVLANSIESGKNYIIVSGGYALKNDDGSVASVSVTPADGVIEFEPGTDDALVWTAASETGFTANGHFSLSNGGYRLNRKSTSGSFSLTFVATGEAMDKYGVWDLQTYNSNTYLFHDSSSTMRCWLYYDSGWKISYRQSNTDPSSTEKPTQLYVEENP